MMRAVSSASSATGMSLVPAETTTIFPLPLMRFFQTMQLLSYGIQANAGIGHCQIKNFPEQQQKLLHAALSKHLPRVIQTALQGSGPFPQREGQQISRR